MTRRRSVAVLAASLAAAIGVPLASLAYWTAPSTPGGRGASVAGSVGAGGTPSVVLSGRAVTLTWPASLLSTGAAVSGYTASRADASQAGQIIGAGCAGTLTGLSCTETGVPDGSWSYRVTPRYATNWQGPVSSASSAVTIAVPGAPTGVSTSPRDSALLVSWSVPGAGSSPITGYTATASPSDLTCTTTTATSCTLAGLTNGTAYSVTVSATSAIGTGPASTPTSATPLAAPGAPTGVSAPAGDGSSSVTWTAPASAGGGAVTGYTVTAVPTSGPSVTCTSTSSPCALQPLVNGLTYTVTVSAANAYGTGPASAAASTSPYPTALFTSSNLALWLDGADASTVYSDSGCTTVATTGAVACWKDKSGRALNVSQATAANRMTMTTLNGRQALTSTTSTWLDSGSATGTFRTVLAVANPTRSNTGLATLLAAPANTDYSVRLNSSQLRGPGASDGNDWQNGGSTWTDGALNGTAATTGAALFEAEAPSPRTNQTVSISSSFLSRGLDGTLAEVLAFNRVLTGGERRQVEEYLARKWATTVTPSAPASVTATVGAYSGTTGSIVAGWTVPAWDGDSAVTSYTATATPGGATCTANGTGCTITGLTVGGTYTISVVAINGRGAGGAASSPATLIPAQTVAGAPTGVTASPFHLGATVAWAPPTTYAATVTSYTATAAPGGASCTTSGTTCEITGLTNGTAYSVTVTDTNSVGTSAASGAATATPGPQPTAPLAVVSSAASTSTSISWTAPLHPGGSAVSGYTVTATPFDSSLATRTCSAATSPCTLSGLTDGAPYSVVVVATNTGGNSPGSTPLTATSYPSALLTSGNLGAWVDAADPGSVFSDTGCTAAASSASTIGCVRSRVGSLSYTQPTAANQFGLTTLNGVRAFSATATTWLTGSGSASFRTVVSAGTAARNGNASTTFAAPANSDFSQRVINAALPGSPGASAVNGNDWHSGGSAWTSGVLNGAPPSSGAAVYVSESSGTVTNSSSISTSFLNRGFVGPLGEVLAFNRVLTSAERRQVEEYLARKWGAVISPAAPGSPSATPNGGGTATVTWTAPAWNGGAAITSYTVTPSTGTGTCTWSSGLSAGCTGLSTTSQTFSVAATNAIGRGPAAVSAAVTPTTAGTVRLRTRPLAPTAPAPPPAPSPAEPPAPSPAPLQPACEPARRSGAGEPVEPPQDHALAQGPRADVDRREAKGPQCLLRDQGPREQLPGPAG